VPASGSSAPTTAASRRTRNDRGASPKLGGMSNALGYLAMCALGIIVLGVVLVSPGTAAWAINYWWVILGGLFALAVVIASHLARRSFALPPLGVAEGEAPSLVQLDRRAFY
jgi:biotin transporter BioY